MGVADSPCNDREGEISNAANTRENESLRTCITRGAGAIRDAEVNCPT